MQTTASHGPAAGLDASGPGPAAVARWRALLETRWQARLREVTELALAYHEAAAAQGHGPGGSRERSPRLDRLLRQTVASRRALADTEEALARLSAGSYGRCESCAGAIAAERLAVAPETRYCARCAPGRAP